MTQLEKGDLVVTTDDAISFGATEVPLTGKVMGHGHQVDIIRVWIVGQSVTESWHESFWKRLEDVCPPIRSN